MATWQPAAPRLGMFGGLGMKKLLLAGVGVAAMVGSAMAADMPPMKAPAYAPPFSWTGCYIGGHFGSFFGNYGWNVAAPSVPAGAPESTFNATDLLLGVQGSCDYQVGSWVFGAQGDGAWMNTSGTAVGFFTGLTDRVKVTSLSSATARIGYALDRWLPYAKAGGAWVHDRYDAFTPGGPLAPSVVTSTRSGWTVGGGIEYAVVSNLSLFIEYDYYDFGTKSVIFTGPAFPAMAIHERDSVVKVGGNWKIWPW
jgi:outer membrane immunogenic protein